MYTLVLEVKFSKYFNGVICVKFMVEILSEII